MTTNVPPRIRGRALSVLGGTYRLGYAIGPFASAAILVFSDEPRLVAALFSVCLVIIVCLLGLAREPSPLDLSGEELRAHRELPVENAPVQREALGHLLWRYRSLFATLGLACSVLTAVRQVRLMILPLWGLSIGLAPEALTVVVGVSGVVDFALFYVGGQIVDRFGRRWVAVPSTVLIGGAFVALAFTHDLPSGQVWFTVLAVVLGIGNGLGSGIVITLASDNAPRRDPAPFLGAWRLLTDVGGAAGPVALSALAVFSLPIAVGVVGVIAIVDAVALGVLIPARSLPE
jgi:MFS family permease